jgi:fumarate reductase flavoprotein subunit
MPTQITRRNTDILVLGAGGAGLLAALHAKAANPALDVTIAVKGLLGKCGCTRMVQGGYNVAIAEGDSAGFGLGACGRRPAPHS